MKDFLVHIYVDRYCFTDTLSSLYERSKNLILAEKKTTFRLSLPVLVEDGKFVVTDKMQTEIHSENKKISRKRIDHGDFLTVSQKDGLVYYLLFQSLDTFSVKTKICKMKQSVSFGRSDENDIICSINHYAARNLATVENVNGSWYLCANGFGVSLNREQLEKGERHELNPMDRFSCFGVQCIFLEDQKLSVSGNCICRLEEAKRCYVAGSQIEKEEFTIFPRIYSSLHEGEIKIDPPTSMPQLRKMPFILQIGPTLTMSVAMVATIMISLQNNRQISSLYSSMIMAATMLISALLWPFLSRRYERKQYEHNVAERKAKYGAYIQDSDNQIAVLFDENKKIWNERLFPSMVQCMDRLQYTKRELWVRTENDQDFLDVRLGLGKKPFEMKIEIPVDRFSLEDDELKNLPQMLKEKYQTMSDVPVVLSLDEHRVSGIVGENEKMYMMANQLISQLVYHHSAEEMKLVLIAYDDNMFSWLLNFPHLWNEAGNLRFTASSRKEVREVFEYIEQEIAQRQEQGSDDFQHYVFLIADEDLIEGETLSRYILQETNEVNFHSIFLSESFSSLPSCTSAIVQYDSSMTSKEKYGLYEKNKNNNILQLFESDAFSPDKLKRFMYQMDRCVYAGESDSHAIPERIQFLEMFKVGNVEELPIASNWQRNSSHQSLAVPVGMNQKGELFYLDLHEKYHGCHGLVAGTTGSGKSEFLQGLLLSLMIHFSSDEVSFVLIDFKGGDMARPFVNTPHLCTTISNLSTSILYRAEVSLRAEIERRLKVFNQVAADLGMDKIDINVYHRLYKDGKLKKALPHLIIVIDEFAQLKTQRMEFMSKLIDIAQVGRSLGIHLILATQKPSGVVDPQIQSNSRFKVCLKVSGKEDSVDMIHRPDAAYIKQPGRACIQIGYDEINEVVQSGFAGAPYVRREKFIKDSEISAYTVSHSAQTQREYRRPVKEEKTGQTQIEAIIKHIRHLADQFGYRPYSLWLPPLSDFISTENLQQTDAGKNVQVPIGIIDDIYSQKQPTLNLILQGNIAVYGSGGSGKSTLIQTLLAQITIHYSLHDVQYTLIDMSSRSFSYLKSDPHCMNVAFGDEKTKIKEIFSTLKEEINQRKKLFENRKVSTYEAFKAVNDEILPFEVIVIENYALFRENYYEYEEKLIEMMSSAVTYGLCFILTANSSNSINYKVANHIGQKFALHMNDAADYQSILGKKPPFELDQIAGRGFMEYEKRIVEFQTAIIFGEPLETKRTERIQELFEDQKKQTLQASSEEQDKQVQHAIRSHPLFDAPFAVSSVRGRKCGFDLKYGNAVICSQELDTELAQQLIKGHTNVYVVDPINVLHCEENRHIHTADQFSDLLSEMRTESKEYILLIHSFDRFYRMLKNEDVFPFSDLLNEKERIHVITIETVSQIKRYYSLPEPLHKKLMHGRQGMIIGVTPNIELCGLLSDSLYKSAGNLQEIDEEEAWMYVDQQFLKVSKGGI